MERELCAIHVLFFPTNGIEEHEECRACEAAAIAINVGYIEP